MLSTDVIGTEKFQEMPAESQALYMHLNSETDDDGFVQPLGILRKTTNKIDSLKLLFAKGYLFPFPNNWAILRDFRISNTISPSRRARKEPRPELKLLHESGGRYYLREKINLDFTAWLGGDIENDDFLYTNCIQLVAEVKKEVNKESEQNNLENENGDKNAENAEKSEIPSPQLAQIREKWAAKPIGALLKYNPPATSDNPIA